MESRNPVFNRTEEFKRGGYATFDTRTAPQQPYDTRTPSSGELQDMYQQPSATPTDTQRMTLDDVVTRTAFVFGVLLIFAAGAWAVLDPASPGSFGIILVGAIGGLVLGLINSFKKEPSPALILAYAAFQGVFVGGISKFYEARWDGIVGQAVLGTLAAFTTMLVLYKTGVVRNSPKFQKILIIAGFGYLAFGLVHFLGVMFGWWDSIYFPQDGGTNMLGVLISAGAVVLASLFLVLDFDFIEQGIRNGLPQRFAWTAAFGLVVTLVWLYLEMLRLLAILRGND
jgi:uncharacterized YccA/Bax inhibitor family protein